MATAFPRVVPLADRTLLSNNSFNVANNNPPSTKKQNNPYAGSVLPMASSEAQLQLSFSSSFAAEFDSALQTPVNSRAPPRPTSFPRNPYAEASAVLAKPNPPPAQLTKVYVDGRPVPVQKAPPTPPLALTSALVTVSFRRHSGTFLFDLTSKWQSSTPVESYEQLVGLNVVVDGDRGEDLGCVQSAEQPRGTDENLPCVRRIATAADMRYMNVVLPAEEQKALALARAEAVHLPQNECLELTDATFQMDQKKLTIWYRFPGRIYFVPLLRALNQVYRCRIWMEREGGALPEDYEGGDMEPMPVHRRRHHRRHEQSTNRAMRTNRRRSLEN